MNHEAGRSHAEMGIWGEEGGLQLQLVENPDGSVRFQITTPTLSNEVVAEITIAKFRQQRIIDYLTLVGRTS